MEFFWVKLTSSSNEYHNTFSSFLCYKDWLGLESSTNWQIRSNIAMRIALLSRRFKRRNICVVGDFAQGVEELASGLLAMKSQESLACIHDFTFIFGYFTSISRTYNLTK